MNHRCKKTLTPRIKNVKKRFEKKELNKHWIKNVVDKITNYSKQMKKFFGKIIVLVSYSVHDNVWEIWLFIREFRIAAMLNSSLRNRFM